MRRIVLIFILGLLAIGVSAQKQPQIETMDLAGAPCGVKGGAPWIGHETLTGWVVKRNFMDDETTLANVIIKDAKDRRSTVNFDVEFLDASRQLEPALADALVKGAYVRFETDVCGRIYMARRVKVLKQ
jgi:hypothetical protein